MKRILVSRFSALGDVTIALHVIKAVLEQNKDVEIILLTKPLFSQLFENIDRLNYYKADLKNKHKGILGLKRLSNELTSNYNFDYFIDIHNVLRTKILRFFLPSNIKKEKINKGRKEKKLLTRKRNKQLKELPHSAERYAEVFRKAGLLIDLDNYTPYFENKASKELLSFLNKFDNKQKIAVAPFAAHKTKMYPLEKMEIVVSNLSLNNIVFILGGGDKEKSIAEKWEKKFDNVYSVIGKFKIKDEISLIDKCKYTITMDSGNMHLASLTSTKIISIWGATHPFLGFKPFKKEDTVYIQKNIHCRPCSVFGNKKCYRDKMYCMEITPDKIIEKIQ